MIKFLLYIPIVLSLTGCAQSESFDQMVRRMGSKTVPYIQPDSIPDGAVLVDRRETEEISVSRIPGAVSDKEFEKSLLDTLPRDAVIVVYCSVGYRSGKYGEELLDQGFTEVYNLYGGIFKWVNDGHQVVNDAGETQRVHTYNKKWSKWLVKGEKTW